MKIPTPSAFSVSTPATFKAIADILDLAADYGLTGEIDITPEGLLRIDLRSNVVNKRYLCLIHHDYRITGVSTRDANGNFFSASSADKTQAEMYRIFREWVRGPMDPLTHPHQEPAS